MRFKTKKIVFRFVAAQDNDMHILYFSKTWEEI